MPPKVKSSAKAKAKRAAKGAAKKAEPKVVAKESAALEISKIFRHWDTSGDGRISENELRAILRQLGPGPLADEEAVTAILAQADLDNDGFIDYDEFVKWLYDAPDAVKQLAETSKIPPKDEVEGGKRLDDMLSEVFKCFDLDHDGQLERVEMLDVMEQLANAMDEVFNIKSRKDCVEWFKEAGAEGTPLDGMFLSFDLWKSAYLSQLKKNAGCTDGEPSILADYLYKNIAERLFKITYPPPVTSVSTSAEAGAADAEPVPSYPMVIRFTELANAIETARKAERSVLICSSGRTEVEKFLSYHYSDPIDCKQMINEISVTKSVSKEAWQEEASGWLKLAMNYSGHCKPLHLRLDNSAFDWKNFCCSSFPADVFSPALWTPAEALKCGLIDEDHKRALGMTGNWKDFHIVITSTFDLASANDYLPKMIPHWDELAVIVILE